MGFPRRLRRLFAIACIGMAVIWLRVLQLQVVEGDMWTRESRAKRERSLRIPAPRGRILDRGGRPLAWDEPVFQLAFRGWDWERRGRRRCTRCGRIHFHRVDTESRRTRCGCDEEGARLVPLPGPDLGPLERALGVDPGELARRGDARVAEIGRIVEALRQKLEREGKADFLLRRTVDDTRRDLLHRPYLVASDVGREVVRLVELDETGAFRGFLVRTELRRRYAEDGPSSHLIGFVSKVESREELERLEETYDANITFDSLLGREGVERAHQAALLGRLGAMRQARDADGEFTVLVDLREPHRGKDVHLALTAEACRAAEEALKRHGTREGYFPGTQPSGGFVAMYADTGEVVAWGELPRFDAGEDLDRLFHPADAAAVYDPETGLWMPPEGVALPQGLTDTAWREALTRPAPWHLSRVSQIAVEPGSTMKVFIGLGLLDGLRHMGEGARLPYPGHFDCSSRSVTPGCHAHRAVDFVGAIEVSCNRFFALSVREFREHWPVYRRSIPALLARLGFGQSTGCDVSGEAAGRLLRDYKDFDPRRAAQAAVAAVRKAGEGTGLDVRMTVDRGFPALVAGTHPDGLRRALERVLDLAARAAPGGRMRLHLAKALQEERDVHLRFEVIAQPHPGVAPSPWGATAALREAARHLQLPIDADVQDSGLVTLVLKLRYHERVGRRAGDPLEILPDDGRNVAIGQGPITATPLQMVRAVAAFANGGVLVTPHVALAVGGAEVRTPSVDLDVDSRHLDRVRAGMRAVVSGPQGTAARGWGDVPATVFGKTGTAQVGRWWRLGERGTGGPWHHWFVGFAEAPGRRPIAFACVLHSRNEGGASRTSARAAHDFLRWWFRDGPGAR